MYAEAVGRFNFSWEGFSEKQKVSGSGGGRTPFIKWRSNMGELQGQ